MWRQEKMKLSRLFTINSARLSLYLLIGFVLSVQLSAADQVWSEKRNARELVKLPSLSPVVEELDETVVFITSTASTAREPSRGFGRGPSPFPDEFLERFFGGPMPNRAPPRRSSGSGFVISSDGYILTNNHVIQSATEIEVKFGAHTPDLTDDETFKAEVVGSDPRTDIALIKVKTKKKLKFAHLGDSDEIKKGDWVMAFGNPFGLEHSVSVGIVSAKEREISSNENRRFDEFIQTDAAINFGNSGGPLVNLKGEVIGINTAITAQGSGIGFALPINLVKRLVPQLVDSGRVSRGFLGVMIRDVDDDIREAMGLKSHEGVFINEIAPDGPAAKSALRPGDVVLRIEGKPTPDARSLQKVVGSRAPGSEVSLEFLREGKRMKTSVKLGSLDKVDEDPTPVQVQEDLPTDILGLAVKNSKSGEPEVRNIDTESNSFRSGVIPGDVIRQISFKGKRYSVKNAKEYQELVKKVEEGDSVMLNLERNQGNSKAQLFVAFRVPKTDK